jgi:hypothetical protein
MKYAQVYALFLMLVFCTSCGFDTMENYLLISQVN